jgi:hypothetical protein
MMAATVEDGGSGQQWQWRAMAVLDDDSGR